MPTNIAQEPEQFQGKPEEIDRFIALQFAHQLSKSVKTHFKSIGCYYNSLFHAWLCPQKNHKEAQEIIKNAGIIVASERTVPMPKGMIPSDAKAANRLTRLEILEDRVIKDETILLTEIYNFDPSLRPEDFATLPDEKGKSPSQIAFEKNFHTRWITLQSQREEIEQLRQEQTHPETASGERIFDSAAPLLIADAIIKEQFLWNNQRTLRYCSDSFWRWGARKYDELHQDAVRQSIYDFLRDATTMNLTGKTKSYNPNKFKVDHVFDALKAICYQNHHPASGAVWLDEMSGPDPNNLICFHNGILDIESWLKDKTTPLLPHTPLLLNVNTLPFDFDPDAPSPSEWLGFLNSVWANDLESQQILQEWMGYCLTQDTRLHKILLIVGPPRSGKGTIGRILRELLGPHNVVGPTLSGLGGEFGLQPLLNKMLATISDARLTGKHSNSVIIERLLSISGEDPLTINRKFLPSITVQLPTRIMIMTNELPDMRDASGALAKRYIILTMTKSWLDKENPNLFNQLCHELSGILLWALEGLVRLRERGYFLQPASSAETIEELEAMTSPIKAFVKEKCDLDMCQQILVNDLYEAWCAWCDSTGYDRPGNIQSFGKNLRAAFPQINITRPQNEIYRCRYYGGIALLTR